MTETCNVRKGCTNPAVWQEARRLAPEDRDGDLLDDGRYTVRACSEHKHPSESA